VGGCLIPTISYTQLALGFMFFEHVLVLLLLMAATFVVSGLRLFDVLYNFWPSSYRGYSRLRLLTIRPIFDEFLVSE